MNLYSAQNHYKEALEIDKITEELDRLDWDMNKLRASDKFEICDRKELDPFTLYDIWESFKMQLVKSC